MRECGALRVFQVCLSGFCLCSLLFVVPAEAGGPRPVSDLKPGEFLYAVPELPDPNFYHTVILIITYNDDGAMGLVINRPTSFHMAEVIPDLGVDRDKSPVLYFGGPVQRDRIFLMLQSESPPENSLEVMSHLFLSMSRDVLDEKVRDKNASRTLRVYSGYTGWAPGQLEHELARGDWIVGNAQLQAVFAEDPETIWQEVYTIREKIEVHRPGTGLLPVRWAGSAP